MEIQKEPAPDSLEEQKTTHGLLGKMKKAAFHTFDRNDDGKLDRTDLSSISDSIGNAAKKAVENVKDTAVNSKRQLSAKIESAKRDSEYKSLNPIFCEDLESAEFYLPKLVRISEIDKKHAESEICRDSIGYQSVEKDLTVVHIYRNKTDAFGLTFYPDLDSDVYYADPSNRDHYIALDEYFNYLKIARINELQKIAQDLGAKHFRVLYKEDISSLAHSKNAGKAKANKGFNKLTAEASHEASNNSHTSVEIAAEMDCLGHEPVKPQLHYLQRETSIQTLIALRMDKNPMLHQKLTLKLSNSSGIKVKDAMKIDAALGSMKCDGSISVTKEAQNEDRRYFEYEIDF